MPPITAFGEQPAQSDEKPSGIARFALGAGAIAGLGFIPLRSGRVWDKYIAGIRAVETGFPAAILRTFRTSEFLSPLETYQTIGVTGRQLAGAGVYREFLQRSLGLTDVADIELRRTGLAFGDIYYGGRRAGLGLQIQAGTQEGAGIADYFARLKGITLAENESLNRALLRGRHQAFETAANYYEWLDSLSLSERQQRIILGAPFREQVSVFGRDIKVPISMRRHLARVELISTLMRAKMATTTGRLNVLLSKPLELPGVGPILRKLPFLQSAAVKPGANLSMLGGYLKTGVAIAAAWKGLEYYDYVRAQGGVWSVALGTAGGAAAGGFLARGPGRRFSPAGLAVGAGIGLYTALSPRFEHGLFHGAASIFTDINLMRAKFSETIGLGESLREQEAVTPGLISLKTALGFAGIGAMSAGLYGYGGYLTEAVSQRVLGGAKQPLADVLDATRKARAQKFGALWETGLGKRIAGIPRIGKYLSRVKHPMALGALGGLAAWGILSSGLSLLSGNVMAAVPGLNLLGTAETPEELEAIYSGEQEVPIRKGRWWEMGRCLIKSNTYRLYTGQIKSSDQISIGDVLIGRDYCPVKVLNIFTRHHTGEVYLFSTAFDRDWATGLTSEHIVPILRKQHPNSIELFEVRASEVQINDYVEVPVQKLDSNINKITSNDYRDKQRLCTAAETATNPAILEYNGRIFAAIRSIIIEEYNDTVYDFEVDHPDHLFQAGTFLVHNSPYEGGRIMYYRPHMLQRLKTRAYQKGLYGIEEEKWEYDPWLHPLKALFGSDEWKYHYEQKYMYERPAPLTGTYGEEVPFVGPLLAATVGKALKPRKKVRPEEWELGGGAYMHHPDIKGETEPVYGFGGIGPGAPVSPEETSQLLNELMYRRREAVGLVGFATGAIQEAITGREEYLQNLQTMATMGRETGAEYWLYEHLNVGGAAGASEVVRRFIPHRRYYLDEYNPLRNVLPSWMPEDYFLDLKYGNPWDKIPEAEIRLPGAGYTALHPELEGVAPEEYPLYHRLKILADVAMWSDEYRQTLSEAKRHLPDIMQERVRDIERQVQSRKIRREFKEYKFREEELEELQVTVEDVMSPSRIRTKELGGMIVELQGVGRIQQAEEAQAFAQEVLGGKRISLMVPSLEERRYDKIAVGPRMKAVAMIDDLDYGALLAKQQLAANAELKDEFQQLRFTTNERMAGELWETIGHQLETPLEYLTPISPAAKLIRQRSAIEEYIAAEAIGTNAAFWNRPIANFLQPAAAMAQYEAGITNIPEHIQERRCLPGYSLIQTDYGTVKHLDKIRVGDTVITRLGTLGQVQKVHKNHINTIDPRGILYRITCSAFRPLPLDVTYDHKVLAIKVPRCHRHASKTYCKPSRDRKVCKTCSQYDRQYIPEWIPAHDLTPGDFIAYPIPRPKSITYISTTNYCCDRIGTTAKIIPDIIPLTAEFGTILGYYLAEGSMSTRVGEGIVCGFNQTEIEYHQKLKLCIEQVFGTHVSLCSGESTVLVSTKSVMVGELIEKLCGRKEYKTLAAELLGGPPEFLLALLRAYFEGDAHIPTSGKQMNSCSVSVTLLAQLRNILMMFGIGSNVCLDQDEHQKVIHKGCKAANCKKSYLLSVNGRALQQLNKLLEFDIVPSTKTTRSPYSWFIQDNFIFTRITNISIIKYDDYVYDLTIDTDPSFCTVAHCVHNSITEYFDMLTWWKNAQLEAVAQVGGERAMAAEHRKQKAATMFGVDVFGSPVNILRALPRRERDFFNEFVNAQTIDDRKQILSLIPDYEQRLYVSQWARQAEAAAFAKREAGLGTAEDNRLIAEMSVVRQAEGFEWSPDLEEQWLEETGGQISFDEWIRLKKAAEYFSTHSLPDPSWVGWCIPPDQEILLPNCKIILADDVLVGSLLSTINGERSVQEVLSRETQEDMLTIKVHHNSTHAMCATSNHIVLGIRTEKCKYNLRPTSVCSHRTKSWKCQFCTTQHYESYKPQWMPMHKVDTNTFLPIPLLKHSNMDPLVDIGQIDCFPSNISIRDDVLRPKTGRIKPMNRFIKLDPAVCWLVGYYLAEGNVWAVGNRMRGVQFTAHVKEMPILELAQKIIKEYFGLDSVIRTRERKTGDSAYLVVASGMFGWLINHWVGRFCDKKVAPSWLEDLTQKSQIALLDGLLTGDSTKDERGRLVLANKQLCELAKRLYEMQGIPVSIHGSKQRNGKSQYAVEALRASLNTIVGENFIAYRVETIQKEAFTGKVLDFKVEDQHMYCSPVGIYHNSPSVDLEDVKLKYVEMAALDHHDFDLWGARKRSLARKPYINEQVIAQMETRADAESLSTSIINARMTGRVMGDRSANIFASRAPGIENTYNINIKDKRERLVEDAYRQLGA